MSQYKITTLEIGRDRNFPAGIAFDFWHMAEDKVVSPFGVTLIQGEGHNILFDCGFDLSRPEIMGRIETEKDENCRDIVEVLDSVGLKPEDIDSVIISHCHWDHLCGVGRFANSKLYVQKKELESWRRVIDDDNFPLTHKCVIDRESLDTLISRADRGEVICVDGEAELFPGIRVKAAAGHSFAQMLLLVDADAGRYAVIGDAAMRPESFTGTEGFPCFLPNLKFAVGTIEDIVSSYREILAWVDNDAGRIIMTHDGTRNARYPTTRSKLGLDITTICE